MLIRFGYTFDGLQPRRPGHSVGEAILGPERLLSALETQLGLPPALARAGEALLAYRAALEEADTGHDSPRFYRRSLAVDPVGVARTLLGWRERWYEAGWIGRFAGEVPRRLEDMAAVERLAASRVPLGRGERLQRVAAALASHVTQIEQVELHDDPSDLPAGWRRVLNRLPVVLAPGIESAPGAAPGTDLHRVQERLVELRLGHEGRVGSRVPLGGDGSFVVVRGVSRDLTAQAIGADLLRSEQREATLLIAERDGIVLDNALERAGLPRCGFQHFARSRGVTEVLRLCLALVWAPVDPHRLLQLLVHPVGPLPRRVRGRLAEAVAAQPGIGGSAWRSTIDRVTARARDAGASDQQVTDQLAEIDYWLAGPRFSPEAGAPLELLIERAQRCAEWLGRRLQTEPSVRQSLFAAALAQAGALIDGLAQILERGRRTLPWLELERLVDEVTADAPDPATFAEAGRIPAATDPATVTTAWDTVVWWNLALPSREVGYPWSDPELEALLGQGVALPEVAERLRARSRAWLRPILNASRRLVLAVHESDEGDHPLWAQIESSFSEIPTVAVDESLLSGCTPLPVLEVPTRPLPPRALPSPRRWWQLPQDVRIAAREVESYSSLAKLCDYPHEWVLQYPARLAAGRASSIADGPLLYGNLGHRLIEVFFAECPDWATLDDETVTGWFAARLSGLVETEAAVLLEPGRGVDRQRVSTILEGAHLRLLGHLRSAEIRAVAVEEGVEAPWGGIRLRGATDLLLTDPRGREIVVDVKWGRERYRGEELASNRHLQLATYAYLRKGATRSKDWPPHAYFILQTGNLLAQDTRVFPGARIYASESGEGAAELWGRVAKTYAWRWRQLGAGEIEVPTDGTAPDDRSTPPASALPPVERADPFDDYQWLTGWDSLQ